VRDRIDKGIKVESRQIWVLSLDKDNVRQVIPKNDLKVEKVTKRCYFQIKLP
jgi:hypothetical protein